VWASGSSAVVVQLTNHPKFEGSNLVATGMVENSKNLAEL
jgi:hypothetical protein